MKKKVISIFTSLAMLCSLLGVIPTIEVSAAKRTPNEIVAVANELYNTTWTPLKDVPAYGYGYGNTYVFNKGGSYHLPYGMPVNTMTFIGFNISVSDFINQTKDLSSKFYTLKSGYNTPNYPKAKYCPYYSMDCSSFVGYCWGISARQDCGSIRKYCSDLGKCNSSNVGKLQIGDALVSSGHIVLVTNVSDGKYEITEETPPQLTRNTYTSSQLVSKYGSSYSILRYADVAPEPSIPEEKPVDIGTNFFSSIINSKSWLHLTNDLDNASFKDITYSSNQQWKFERQDDGSYKIISCLNGKVLDIDGYGTENGTNVVLTENSNNAGQHWFIYGSSGNYYFKTACSDLVLDMNGSSENYGNAQLWGKLDNDQQKMQMWKSENADNTILNGCLLPIDVGTNFFSSIINNKSWLHLTNDLDNASFKDITYSSNQQWKFERQDDGSYKIISCLNGKVLDIDGYGTENGTNVALAEDNDNAGQRWFIYGSSGNYYFKSSCSGLVLDMNGSSENYGNAQLWGKLDNDQQKMQMWKSDGPDVPVTTTITTTSITTTTQITTTTSSTTTNTTVIPIATTKTSTTVQLPITTTTQTETIIPKPVKTNADLNGDGIINIADIVEFQKIALKKYNDIEYIVDLNGDGVMNVFDMIILKRAVLTKS